MPEYLAPGVYIEEASSRMKPIEGVSTSTAGFIGQVDGKYQKLSDKPILVQSWIEFINFFGDFDEHNKLLAYGIRGFFENGGKRARIVPVTEAVNTRNLQGVLKNLSDMNDISLIVMPGITDAPLQEMLIDHCDKMKDRFAILDAQPTRDIKVSSIKGSLRNSKNTALYFPRIRVHDPLSGRKIYIHPSGHIAGIYARVDANRGVHKAPANEPIQGTIDVELNLSAAEQSILNPAGINVIRKINKGIVVWGARTLGGETNGQWKYVNVRRHFIYLEQSIKKGLQWTVFEINNQQLRANIHQTISNFLTVSWRGGAIMGNKTDEAFFVKCDQENNTQGDIDAGRVIIDVGVALLKPAEFVLMRISQKTREKV